MANSTANVVAGKPLASGGILIGERSATAPEDALSVLSGFSPAGYIGEDGVTESVDRSSDKVKAWGGDTVKVMQTEHGLTYSFNFIESLNSTVLKAYYGDENVDTTPATAAHGTQHTVLITGASLPVKSYVFEIKDGDAKIRIYVPNAEVSEQGETVYADAEVVAYPMTIEALPDELGVKAYKFLDDGQLVAAA